MTLRLNLVNLAWEPVSGASSYDILLDGVKIAQAGPRAKTTKINIPEGAEHKVTIKAQPSGQVQEAKFEWASVGAVPPPPPPPPPPPSGLGSLLPARLPESTGTVYYVSTSGSDSANGTSQATAWRTIQKAANTLVAGQKALVAAGSYTENVTFNRNLGGPQPATIEALDPANRPIVTGYQRFNNSGSSVAAFWRIRNLRFNGAGTGVNFCVKVTNDSSTNVPHDLEFYGCEAYNANGGDRPQGFTQIGGTGSSVPYRIHYYNNLVHHNGNTTQTQSQMHGMYLADGEACVIANNVIRDESGYHLHIYNGGAASTQTMSRSFVVNNTMVRSSTRGGILVMVDASGVPANYLPNGNRIYNNIVVDAANTPYWSEMTNSGPANQFNLWDANLEYNCGGSLYTNSVGSYASSTFVHPPLDVDPLFVNTAGNDFHLRAGSPAIGVGLVEYTPTFDFDGNTRTTADLGAYRH